MLKLKKIQLQVIIKQINHLLRFKKSHFHCNSLVQLYKDLVNMKFKIFDLSINHFIILDLKLVKTAHLIKASMHF